MRVAYTSETGTGAFSQLAGIGPLQGLGIATMLISAREQRVRARDRRPPPRPSSAGIRGCRQPKVSRLAAG